MKGWSIRSWWKHGEAWESHQSIEGSTSSSSSSCCCFVCAWVLWFPFAFSCFLSHPPYTYNHSFLGGHRCRRICLPYLLLLLLLTKDVWGRRRFIRRRHSLVQITKEWLDERNPHPMIPVGTVNAHINSL